MKKILSICLVLFMFIVPLNVFADEPTKEDKVEILTEVVSNSCYLNGRNRFDNSAWSLIGAISYSYNIVGAR